MIMFEAEVDEIAVSPCMCLRFETLPARVTDQGDL